MLPQEKQLEKDIQRSLDRLAITFKQKKTFLIIPAFYYSANLLNNYAKRKGSDAVQPQYFKTFKYLVEELGRQDFACITKNHQEIMNDILQIVCSELFVECLRPDIKIKRLSTMNYSESGEGLTHRSNCSFILTQQEIKSSSKIEHQVSHVKNGFSIESQSSLMNRHDDLWEMMQKAYRQHNIDEAYQKSREYIAKVNKNIEIPSSKQELLDIIENQYNVMIESYKQFDKGEWEFDKEQNGMTLEYKIYQQEKIVAIKIVGQFDIPLEPFLSIISEIDLMGGCIPYCYDSKELKVISRNQRVGTIKANIPFFTDRETYFYGVGYDRQKITGGIFLYSKTINDDQAFQKKHNFSVPKESEYVRFQYKFFIVEYIPLSKERGRIRLSSKMDLKMDYLPRFILSKSARIFSFDYFKNIIKIAKNYKDSPWQKKANQRPELYEFFKRKVQEMYGQMFG